MTFLNQTLGKNYKWWYLLKYSFRQGNLKLSGVVLSQFAFLVELVITIFIWTTLSSKDPQIVTYFLVGFLVSRLGWNSFTATLSSEIRSGKFTSYHLRPTNFFGYIFVKELGNRTVSNLISAFSVILLLPFYINSLQLPSLEFIVFLPLIITCCFLVDFCGCLIMSFFAFFTEDYFSYIRVIGTILFIFQGSKLPFYILPAVIRPWFEYNPYSWMQFQPLQIYFGKYGFVNSGLILLLGFLLCLLMFVLARVIFKLGLKKNEAVGL